ncbi:TM0106 family RecB-like putative nuclease [soil metagenome]
MYLLGSDPIDGATVVYSASDISAAADCEWAAMRMLDFRLGRIPRPPEDEDELRRRAATLGEAHEQRMLQRLRDAGPVVEIDRPEPQLIAEAAAATEAAFRAGAAAVYQAAFFDGRFLGYADFILLDENGDYEVYDSKLARRAKVTALLQLAAYAGQLERLGVRVSERVTLVLGDDSESHHRLADIVPVYLKRRARLEQMIDERVADDSATPWADPRYAACGRCAACDEQVHEQHDVFLVAGLRSTQRSKLIEAGVTTIEQLAASTGPVAGIADRTISALRDQAALQLLPPGPGEPLPWRIANSRTLAAIPAPDAGDIFFDFEGDPLYKEGSQWNLDYLFGLVEPDETFRAFWAHDLAGEKQALLDFLDYVRARRAVYPGMHIYHYAAYERTHLLSIAARHGVGEDAVDELLRDNLLVDLYPIVRQGVRVGSRSYSLKKLEPLYMGDRLREGVDNAADSITEYVRFRELTEAGEADAAAVVLQSIADYNQYDCISTLKLRDWLLERAREVGVQPSNPADLMPLDLPGPDPVYLELTELVAGFAHADRTADQQALAMAAAAIDYHRREGKSFWWSHFARLVAPIEDWADHRGVFVIEEAVVERDWSVLPGRRAVSRRLRLEGAAAPGSSFSAASSPFAVYDEPYPPIERSREPGARSAHSRTELELDEDGVFHLLERLEKDGDEYPQLPVALTPGIPPSPGSQVAAISEWGRSVLDARPALLEEAAMDLLRRRPPRGPITAVADNDFVAAITSSLLASEDSYLAVQGPPGTGKTYNGARVIAGLVRAHGWRIGVVAQSHSTVENMLQAIIDAGLDPAQVGKKPKAGDNRSVPWTTLVDGGDFANRSRVPGHDGFVLGGTAWTFSNPGQVPRHSLDLLVVDEAGQFSLASTIASAAGARRLLLLGDPQQLPQVSQGTHPEPVDASALGWLSEGHDVLPPEFGYFLPHSRRMHPALAAPVSRLSYEGRLESVAPPRDLDGVPPGLIPVPVLHRDNATSSPQEAEAVVNLARELIDRRWTDDGETRLLGQDDIIVVAPYNAQVELLREALDAAGLPAVPVGTVDRFQGREAAVSIVSLAASSPADVPRGLEFLLLANRLNVAISRAQWASYLVHSPALTEYLPHTPESLAQLSAFITLLGPPGR